MSTMSLRMSDEDSALLRRLAERETRSMNDTAILAIRRLAEQTVVPLLDAINRSHPLHVGARRRALTARRAPHGGAGGPGPR